MSLKEKLVERRFSLDDEPGHLGPATVLAYASDIRASW